MYRFATESDFAAIKRLWAVDFESYEPYFSWYFDNIYRPERTLCDFMGDKLAAVLQLAPYRLALGGEKLPVCYLVGVITEPDLRGQGRGHALLKEARRYLEQEGYAAALLYTDIPRFYQPLGFRHCYQQQTLSLPVSKHAAKPPDSLGLWDNIPALDQIYRRMTARYDGYILRGAENWQSYLGEQHCDGARLLLAEGRYYVIYVLQEQQLHIVELGFCDEAACGEALEQALTLTALAGKPRLLWHGPCDGRQLLPRIPAKYWSPRPFVMALPLNERAFGLLEAGQKPLWINEYT